MINMIYAYRFLDYCFFSLMGMSVVLGAMRGMSKQLISWFSWFAIVFLCYQYGELLSEMGLLRSYSSSHVVRYLLSVGIISIVSFVWAYVVQYVVTFFLDSMGLVFLDRVLGTVLGLVQGGGIIVLMVIGLGDTNIKQEQWWKESYFVNFTTRSFGQSGDVYVWPYVTDWMQKIDEVLLPIIMIDANVES